MNLWKWSLSLAGGGGLVVSGLFIVIAAVNTPTAGTGYPVVTFHCTTRPCEVAADTPSMMALVVNQSATRSGQRQGFFTPSMAHEAHGDFIAVGKIAIVDNFTTAERLKRTYPNSDTSARYSIVRFLGGPLMGHVFIARDEDLVEK